MTHTTSLHVISSGQSSTLKELHQAVRRMNAIIETIPWIQAIEILTHNIIHMNASPARKLIKLTKLANKLNEALRPHYTCRKGCCSCCSMNTLIYRYEAVRLAEVTNRKMIELPFRSYHKVLSAGKLVYGKQCVFVVDGLCSVYEHRPMVCRLHHSFNASSKDCTVTGDISEVFHLAMFDPDYIETPYHHIVRTSMPKEPWGGIREFFPE